MTWLAYSHLGVAKTVQLTTQPAVALAGIAFGVQPVGRLVDGSGVLSRATGVTVTASKASGTGTLSGTLSVQTVEGVFTFTDLKMDTVTSAVTLSFASSGLTSATSSAFNVTQPNTTIGAETTAYTVTGTAAGLSRTRVCVCDPGSYAVTGTSASLISGAFNYYIGPSGSDSNAGTLGSPWAITALSSKSVIAGKTVGLLDGTYVIQNTDYTSAGQLVGYGGSASAHTVVQAVNPRAAIITGYNGSTYSDSTLLGTRQDYVTFKNLTIRQGASKLLSIDADHVTVTGCDIGDIDQRRHSSPSYGDNTECIRVEQYTGANAPTDILIENCYLHDVLNTAGGATGNNSSAVKIYDCESLTIRNCTMTNTGEPVYCKYNPAGVTVENNFITNFTVTAVYGVGGDENWTNAAAASTFSNYVRNNIILGQQGIDAGATAGAYHIGQQVYVYNNTLYRNGDIGSAITFRDAPGAYIRHYNNIAYGTSSTGYGTVRVEQAADFALSDYNCFSPFTGTSNGASRSSLAVWRTATGWDAGSIASNPVFANAGGTTPADYALAGGSPCLNAGRSNGTSGGSAVDMGAWGNGAPTNIGCDFA